MGRKSAYFQDFDLSLVDDEYQVYNPSNLETIKAIGESKLELLEMNEFEAASADNNSPNGNESLQGKKRLRRHRMSKRKGEATVQDMTSSEFFDEKCFSKYFASILAERQAETMGMFSKLPKRILERILQNLDLPNKLMCRRISSSFQKLIDNLNWEILSLHNCRVSEWKEMATFISANNVTTLDTRGAIIMDNNEMKTIWRKLFELHNNPPRNLKTILVSSQIEDWTKQRGNNSMSTFMINGKCNIHLMSEPYQIIDF